MLQIASLLVTSAELVRNEAATITRVFLDVRYVRVCWTELATSLERRAGLAKIPARFASVAEIARVTLAQ